ncbi:RidA family protein [Streptomyces sp. NPDC057199]|uniref:RidA family protein n=1 Tax=Streptomyces sp. NPDC057199 TaxID=3346047 RepID=UPI00362848F1
MSHTITNPDTLFRSIDLGYSQVVSVPAASELVFLAGQFATDPDGKVTSADFAEQVARSFANLEAALAAVGLNFSHVIRLGTYITDRDPAKIETLVRICAQIWGDQPPAQTLTGVAFFAGPDQLFEVDAIAVRP